MPCLIWYAGVAAIVGAVVAFCAVDAPLVVLPLGIFLLVAAVIWFSSTIHDPSLNGWAKLNELRAMLIVLLLILVRIAAALIGKL